MLLSDSPLPLYYQLAEELRCKIERGEIGYGDRLESEAEMTERYGVGRLTVRTALSRLVNMGYLKKVQGKGTFCSYAPAPPERLNIDVLLDIEDSYFIPYYMKSISRVFQQENCNMLVSDTKDSLGEICAHLERIIENGSDGVILQPNHESDRPGERLAQCFARLEEKKIPLVMIDSAYPVPNASYLRLDELLGGRMAAQYLLSLNHTRAAALYREGFVDSRLRLDGFSRLYLERGLPAPLAIPYRDDGFAQVLERLIAREFTAVFCYNDDMAVALIRALKEEGLSIPGDVSVMGFDDSVLAAAVEPALSTVSHPKQALGEEIARVLLEFVRGARRPPVRRLFTPSVVARASCAPFAS